MRVVAIVAVLLLAAVAVTAFDAARFRARVGLRSDADADAEAGAVDCAKQCRNKPAAKRDECIRNCEAQKAKAQTPARQTKLAAKRAQRKADKKTATDTGRAEATAPLRRDVEAGGKHAAGTDDATMIAHAKKSKHKVNGQWIGDGLNQAIAKAKAEGVQIGSGDQSVTIAIPKGWGRVWKADGTHVDATHARLISKREGGQFVIHGYPTV